MSSSFSASRPASPPVCWKTAPVIAPSKQVQMSRVKTLRHASQSRARRKEFGGSHPSRSGLSDDKSTVDAKYSPPAVPHDVEMLKCSRAVRLRPPLGRAASWATKQTPNRSQQLGALWTPSSARDPGADLPAGEAVGPKAP